MEADARANSKGMRQKLEADRQRYENRHFHAGSTRQGTGPD
jgi:hypothetical protein